MFTGTAAQAAFDCAIVWHALAQSGTRRFWRFWFRHDAEEIAARVFKDDKVGTGIISPGIPICAKPQQPLDFSLLIWRVKVEMDPTAAFRTMIARLK